MTQKLKHYIAGKWVEGQGEGQVLYNAVNGEALYNTSTTGIDIKEALEYARNVGNPNLRKMTFYERGLMIKELALYLNSIKKKYYPISYTTGATKIDSWIDIDGGIGNLFANGSLRRELGNKRHYVDGDGIDLSRGGDFVGHHIMVPKTGVAVHINAFNFPIWGMLEKIAVNLLAGMPAFVKPATITSFLTQAMVQDIIKSGILPEGSLQLLCGSAYNLLDYVDYQDVVTFTGSAETGKMLKQSPAIVDNTVPFNMESDSLNAIVLGEDIEPGTETFNIFIKEVRNEMCTKSGQKCTAIRRVIVPENKVEAVRDALSIQLSKTVIGDPNDKTVRMGSLAGKTQLMEVKERVEELLKTNELLYGSLDAVETIGEGTEQGSFISPILMYQANPFTNTAVHEIEAFGPVSTIIPYNGLDEAIALSKLGKGSLVASIVTEDPVIATDFTIESATHHGRIHILNKEASKHSTGHGSPLPTLVHGGPGRAGGGEEMGGLRGVKHYLQRCAIQGSPTMLTEVTGVYQERGKYKDPGQHLFTKHFEDLEVGETIITAKRTITEADIVNFANVSWDHFYAHVDVTSLDETIFEERVAHGYFVLSAAAGLFVNPDKGPVLLNYGLESCRFTKPVYAGTTIGVRLTVKDKIDQELKDEDDIPKGIVKFLVDVYDQEGETVAIATILTMVKKKNRNSL